MKKIKYLLLCICVLGGGAIFFNFSEYNTQTTQNEIIIDQKTSKSIPLQKLIKDISSNNTLNSKSINDFSNLCDDYLTEINDLQAWKVSKKAEINRFINKLKNDGVDNTLLDHFSKLSGIGIIQGRNFTAPNKYRMNLPFLADINAQLMSSSEASLFQALLVKENYNELFNAFSEGALPLNNYSYISLKNVSPISHLLLKNKHEGVKLAFRLINIGIRPTYIDLITATELNLSVSFIDALYRASNLDVGIIFHELSRYKSLTTIAVRSSSPELVEYWLSLNSPHTPDPFDGFYSNALDLIASPENDKQKEKYLEIFLILMKYSVKPSNSLIVDRLTLWLPDDVSRKYLDFYSDISDNSLPIKSEPFINFKIIDLYRAILHGHLKLIGSDTILNKCFLKTGNKMLRLALNDSSPDNKNNDGSRHLKSNIDKLKLIEKYSLKNQTLEMVKETLKGKKDLTSKLVLQDFVNKDLIKKLEKQKLIHKSYPKSKTKAINEAFAAASKNWESTEKIISDIEFSDIENENNETKLAIKLNFAITTGQPWETIRQLLENGAKLGPNIIFILTRNNNVSLTRKLYSYGLDIHLKDAAGNNAIYHGVIHKAKDIIDYLLSQGVSVNVNSGGLDSLDQALLLVKSDFSVLNIIDTLLRNGITVVQSHKEKVLSFKENDRNLYDQILKQFPQLEI
ncbi:MULTISPECIES: hypothetical protein [unclassified Colwellia]|uniref:hypothetical protein n=1 Tax=unclassified Colwellia TaxID=196834 RepID=UPI0015F72138|nr:MULTISPECIES: hypothetical protein [unclassified Colwellia]MBA6230591.1 hypothetical protein [Colwellia sp. MB02u-7]MBA6236599.1 hypothetical protein [Colwellia sp. MB02u-11]MBA6297948.1 hypothetical protein [Colwellia sp. MB3u-22]MBA6313136.1 hypothetical protein [Colwellia sp. MB3u-64]